MKRLIIALAVLALAAAVLPAFAERGVYLATPTDLCPHIHTKTVYYFDAPDYQPLGPEGHRVSGRATVAVICEQCGGALSVGVVDNAEEICAHVMRGGKCVLCGWENAAPAAREEKALSLSRAEGGTELYSCTLTAAELEQAGDTLVLRAAGAEAALVLQAKTLAGQVSRGGNLTAEIACTGNRAVNVAVRLYAADGTAGKPGDRVSLRFYDTNNTAALTVTYTDPAGGTTVFRADWSDAGYYAAPWYGDGTYQY